MDAETHRTIAIDAFNAAWDLIERADRSDDDDLEMLLLATVSRWHWSKAGGAEQAATGDWQIAHVASLIGAAELAQRFAARCLATAEAEGWDGWRLASAHEGVARACAAAGDVAGRDRHVAAARRALEREADPDDRGPIESQLASIP